MQFVRMPGKSRERKKGLGSLFQARSIVSGAEGLDLCRRIFRKCLPK
jgi:hypothetical protein